MKSGKERGLKKEVRGYWGDVTCSPYFAFGIDCETVSRQNIYIYIYIYAAICTIDGWECLCAQPNEHAEGLFEIHNKNTGVEQHRHVSNACSMQD